MSIFCKSKLLSKSFSFIYHLSSDKLSVVVKNSIFRRNKKMNWIIISLYLSCFLTLTYCHEEDRACFDELLKFSNLNNEGNIWPPSSKALIDIKVSSLFPILCKLIYHLLLYFGSVVLNHGVATHFFVANFFWCVAI